MSQPNDPRSDRLINELQQDIAAQKTLIRRMITKGTPSQAAEDRLRQLQRKLSQLKEGDRV